MTVGEMLARVSSSELTEWAAFEQVYGPLGAIRGDIDMAILAAVIHNVFAGKGKGKAPEDFMPSWDQRKEDLAVKIRKAFGE